MEDFGNLNEQRNFIGKILFRNKFAYKNYLNQRETIISG